MATLTDEEIKELSKEILELPEVIASWQQAYDDSINKEIEIGELEDRNKKFFDDALNQVSVLQQELSSVSGEERTLYNEADLIASSSDIGEDVPHFPNDLPTFSNLWAKVIPKVLDSNNGLPSVVNPSNFGNESGYNWALNFFVNAIQSGFNYGSNITENSTYFYDDRIEKPYPAFGTGITGDFDVNDIILFTSGAGYTLVKVTAKQEGNAYDMGPPEVLANPDIIWFDVLYGDIPAGSHTGTVSLNFNWPAFSESERQGLSVPSQPSKLQLNKDIIDNVISDYTIHLNTVKSDLENLDIEQPYRGQIENNIANIDATLANFASWQSLPSTVPLVTDPSRFDDLNLSNILIYANDRLTYSLSRETEILNSLGNVTQSTDGSYTGTGLYFKLFLWIDKRINVSEGSLSELGGFPSSQLYYIQQRDLNQNILEQYELAYVVTAFSENYTYDAENPSNIIKLTDVTNINNGDNIKLMDNDSVVFDREVDFVNTATNELYLDSPINTDLNAVGKQARIFKEL